jgi:hypothetical protein
MTRTIFYFPRLTDTAREILLGAFTSGTLESIQVEEIRNYCEMLVAEWFARRKGGKESENNPR